MSIRIIMVVHEMNRGGIENFLMNLYRSVDRETIQFDFICHTQKDCAFDEEILSLGGKIYRSPDYRIVNHFQYSKWWNNFFKEHPEYKIIHSHLDSSANIHLRIAKKYGLVTIAHSHSSSEGGGLKGAVKAFLKIGFSNCCEYKFACSKEAAKWLYGSAFVEGDKCRIINNGIDSSKFVYNEIIRDKMRNELGISEGTKVIGHVGRIDANKNQSFLIDILKCLIDQNLDYKLVCIGAGVELENNLNKAKELGLEERVIFTGIKSNVNEYMQAFDIFVMPSIYEGLPVSTVEAQAAGLKCLLSDGISKDCIITDNVEYLSLNDSVRDWANKVNSLIEYNRIDTTNQIKSAGFDIETTANWLVDFYFKLAQ